MKKVFLCFAFIIAATACSRKIEKLELFSSEAFAYSLDSGWELNASVRVKGFDQDESGGQFTAKLSYYADLQTPEGKLVEKISSGVIDKKAGERMTDIPIETQIKLDTHFRKGIYKITFYVKDESTRQRAKESNFFELS
ncbi:MAG: hypothetical protein CVV24_09025 [Ignavibacteriae bacterium HGW-Ignavibacteriae-3]|nr:MAG: hypothetical protein CVV24_09025 [Ignavibacteriae bacterium HGW-Ignavibacteriae-3]